MAHARLVGVTRLGLSILLTLACALAHGISCPGPALTATISQANLTCNGVATGQASTVASGGLGGYTYSWSPSGGSGATAFNLAASTYTVTITDSCGTQLQKMVTLTEPPAIVTSIGTITPVAIAGQCTGSAQVVASGGTGSLSYLWSPTAQTTNPAVGLCANTYQVTVQDANSCSKVQAGFAVLTLPNAPTNVVGAHGDEESSVSFDPGADNGSPITGYTVTSSPDGIVGTGPSSPIVVTGLTNGTAYTFTVTATSAAGTSAPSTASASVTPSGIPDAPTGVTAAATPPGKVTVSFTAPVDTGGIAIASYVVMDAAAPLVVLATGTASPIEVSGLTLGTPYSFVVAAINADGQGPNSAASAPVTPQAVVPGGAARVLARAGDTTALVDVVDIDDGGAPITGYNVTVSPGGATFSGATLPIAVTGLSNGTLYTFTATVTNSAGASSPIGPSHTVRPFAPAPPISPLAYVPSVDDGDVYVIDTRDQSVITRVLVGVGPHAAVVSPVGTRAYVTNSSDDTVSVIDTATQQVVATVPVGVNPTGIAINNAGTRVYVSNTNDNSVSVIETAGNSVLDTVAMTAGTRGLVVSPDGTRVYVSTGVRVKTIDTTTTPNTVAITSLFAGTPADIDVDPTNSFVYVTNVINQRVNKLQTSNLDSLVNSPSGSGSGHGIALAPNGTIYAARPSAGAVAVINSATMALTTVVTVGTAPRGVAVTPNGAHVYVTNENSGNVSVIRTSDNTVLTTILVGSGASGLNRFIGPAVAPQPPAGVSAVVGNAQATVSFTAPYDGGLPITSYTVTSSPPSTPVSGATSPITVAGLTNGTSYTFTVTATNAAGTGNASAPSLAVTPSTIPGPPTGLIGTAGDAQATIAFLMPASNGGSAITGYTASCSGGVSGSSIGTALSITLSPLTNGTTYTCTVVAINANGPSVASAQVMVAPQQPSYALTVSRNGSGTGTITSNPAGINCGATCVGTFANGSTVFLTATPDAGEAFVGWSGCDTVVVNTCMIAMSSDRSATASFGLSPAITSANAATFTVNAAGTFAVAATGSPAPTLSLTGALPSGVSFTAATGVLAGTPALGTVGSYPVIIGAANGTIPSAIQAFTLTVAKADQTIAFTGPGPQTLSSTPLALMATATSGIAVNFTSATTGVCTVSGASVTMLAGGTCTLHADQAGDANYNAALQATQSFVIVANPTRLGNIATRMRVGTGNDVLISGFIIGGASNKRVAIVATGSSLTQYGIANALAHPTITLVRSSDQSIIATNDGWQTAANAAQLTAAGFAPSDALESAILIDLAPGAYTAQVQGAGGGVGVGVVAVYEVDHPEYPLINISTRGQVLTGNDVMIGGFIINGTASETVAIVATGPSLAQYGITNPLANPTLTLVRQSDQAVIATNDDWQAAANAAQLSAAGFAPSNPLEAAILIALPPGAYTAILTGAGGGTGVGIIGVYAVP